MKEEPSFLSTLQQKPNQKQLEKPRKGSIRQISISFLHIFLPIQNHSTNIYQCQLQHSITITTNLKAKATTVNTETGPQIYTPQLSLPDIAEGGKHTLQLWNITQIPMTSVEVSHIPWLLLYQECIKKTKSFQLHPSDPWAEFPRLQIKNRTSFMCD